MIIYYVCPTTAKGDANDPVNKLIRDSGLTIKNCNIYYGNDKAVVKLDIPDEELSKTDFILKDKTVTVYTKETLSTILTTFSSSLCGIKNGRSYEFNPTAFDTPTKIGDELG